MKSIVNISFLVLGTFFAHAQEKPVSATKSKQPLDTNVFKNWPRLTEEVSISSDGKYAVYGISSKASDHLPFKQIITALNGNWQKEINGISAKITFTSDSRTALYLDEHQHVLHLQSLGTSDIQSIHDVIQFQLSGNQLLYKKQDSSLISRSLTSSKEIVVSNVVNFNIVGGKVFVISRQSGAYQLIKLDPSFSKWTQLWKGEKEIERFVYSEDGNRVVLQSQGKFYYGDLKETSHLNEVQFELKGDCEGLSFGSLDGFVTGSGLLKVRFEDRELKPLNPNVNPVQIFSYQDGTFNLDQSRERASYIAIWNPLNNKLVRIEQSNEKIGRVSGNGLKAIVRKLDGSRAESYWNVKGIPTVFVIDLQTGSRMEVANAEELSPSGNFAINDLRFYPDIICTDLNTRKRANLTDNLPIPKVDNISESFATKYSRGLSFYNWTADGQSFIVYDRYDIWQLDAQGIKAPVNLTKGYGRKHHIQFRFWQDGDSKLKIKDGDEIVLTAFNEDTKQNGFYRIKVDGATQLELLTMGNYLYFAPSQGTENYSPPIKANATDVWLVNRQSASESANWYWTKDFKNFKPVSNNHPEKNYDWYTTELIDYTTKDGVKSQAILYRPNNLNPAKRYPVLFNYYEIKTSTLNCFENPDYTDWGYGFNTSMMLSRGYLVCKPDIHHKIGRRAPDIVDCVEGAADAIAKLPYVDSARYGACGGSFGGYATNCLAAFSKKFKALVPISGMSDMVSMYGNYPGLRDEYAETRQGGFGVSLSTDPLAYIKDSPVAFAKDVNTPVLIVNTLSDGNVNVNQGIEWFISLRREGKRAWMLRYQNSDHGVPEPDRTDFYVRMNQFFDHYLKDAPAPVWMTRGISANDTGVRDGLELDMEIKTPRAGLRSDADIKKQQEYLHKQKNH